MDLFTGLVALFSLLLLFLLFYFNDLKKNLILIILYFIYYSFLAFFHPFLLSRVADRALVLWLGVRPEPLRSKSQVQDIGPPETSQPHVISIGESSPRDLCLNTKIQVHPKASKLQCWMPHAKQLARQEHNPNH